jgi:hypothetical protein
VNELRTACASDHSLSESVLKVKRFQSNRFAQSYSQELKGGPYQNAALFFLTELYGEKNYVDRDAQFARIAGALQSLFPKQVIWTAVSLAQLHALTEELDYEMACSLCKHTDSAVAEYSTESYIRDWRAVGRSDARFRQLNDVIAVGETLDRLTRTTGLRLTLKMMHQPARAAGLSSLQTFLETGFDTFAGMSKAGASAHNFLAMIRERETRLINQYFSAV